MTREEKMRLLIALTETAENPNPFEGICWNVDQHEWLLTNATRWMKRKYRKWPHWSGSYAFPVRCTDNWFHHAAAEGTLWDTNTQYGRDRWDLMRFLITELLKEV